MNYDTLDAYRNKVAQLSQAELRELAAHALYHLQCVSGSRNSFDPEYLQATHDAGIGFPLRQVAVVEMHREAAEFVSKNGV